MNTPSKMIYYWKKEKILGNVWVSSAGSRDRYSLSETGAENKKAEPKEHEMKRQQEDNKPRLKGY